MTKDKTSDKTDSENVEEKADKGGYFDMYHFISRKDVMLAAILIVALLLYLFVLSSGAPEPAA